MTCHRLFLPAALLALAAAPALRSAERPKFGFEAALSQPMGDLKDDTNNKPGGSLAFQVGFALGGGHMLRPRLEVGAFQLEHHDSGDPTVHQSTNLVYGGAGCDYLYYPGGSVGRGWYLASGLSVQQWSVNLDSNSHGGGTSTTTNRTTHRRTSPAGFAGAGFQVNRWFGLEGRVFASGYEGVAGSPLYRADVNGGGAARTAVALQTAAAFRW
jgi:hypothetical protein